MTKVARFYGWSPHDIGELSVGDLESYWQCITVIEAQERLMDLTVSAFPNMKENAAKKINREFNKMAYPEFLTPKRVVTTDELDSILKGSGIQHG